LQIANPDMPAEIKQKLETVEPCPHPAEVQYTRECGATYCADCGRKFLVISQPTQRR
jgi:hypothetical protein